MVDNLPQINHLCQQSLKKLSLYKLLHHMITAAAASPSRVKWQGNREKGSGILIIKMEAWNVEEYFGKVCLVSDEEDKTKSSNEFSDERPFWKRKLIWRESIWLWHIIRNSLQCFARVCPRKSNLTTMLLHKNFSVHKVIILTMCNL